MSHPTFTWRGAPSTSGKALARTQKPQKDLPKQISTFGKANLTTSINTERHRVVHTRKAAI